MTTVSGTTKAADRPPLLYPVSCCRRYFNRKAGHFITMRRNSLFNTDFSGHPHAFMPFDRTNQTVASALYGDEIQIQGTAGIDLDGTEIGGLYFAVGIGLELAGGDRPEELFGGKVVFLGALVLDHQFIGDPLAEDDGCGIEGEICHCDGSGLHFGPVG